MYGNRMGNPTRSLGGEPPISSSFTMLQRLATSFDELHRGHPLLARRERALIRLVIQLGCTAVPMCVRELSSSDDNRARWAYALLSHLADTSGARGRVITAMRELATNAAADDASKLRALALLSELDVDMPDTKFHDLQEVHNRSVRQLAACLNTPAEVANAADMLLGQLDDHELASFVDQLASSEPQRGERLIDEMLVRDDVDESIRRELRRQRAALTTAPTGSSLRSSSRRKTHLTIGRREDGRCVIVASQRRPNTRPIRWRVLCCSMASTGALMDVLHEDDYTPGLLKNTVIEPLRSEGYEFEDVDLATARDIVATAARATREAGEPLPRSYYLGRDLLRLFNEHLLDVERETDDNLAALLARGLDLMAREDHTRARPLLERFVNQQPDDPSGRAALGVCFLMSNELTQADSHLQRAAWLEPENPLHYWNLASVAHRQGRLGGCYQCFDAYIDRRDDGGDGRARRQLAAEFMAEYERLARLEYPESKPRIVARADEHLFDARALAKQDQLPEAIAELRKTVRSMPEHNPSWAYLATLYNERGQLAQAKRCAERAIALQPSDAETDELLGLIRQKMNHRKKLGKRPARP